MNDRREVLIVISMGGIGALAGCASSTNSGEDNDTDETERSSGSNTDESESSSESVSQIVQHDLNESFTVGSGRNKIEYNTRNIYTHDTVGSSYLSEEANGRFVTPIIEMTARTNEPITITSDHIVVLREDRTQYEADSGATTYLSTDDRFDVEPMLFEELQPDVSVRTGMVFDVAPGHNYALIFKPTGILSGDNWKDYISIGSV
jgi:hypothetical protein